MPDAPDRGLVGAPGESLYGHLSSTNKEEFTAPSRDPVKIKFSRPHLSAKTSSTVPTPTDEEIKHALAEIDAMVMSDVESPEWETAKQAFNQNQLKRAHDIEVEFVAKLKVSFFYHI